MKEVVAALNQEKALVGAFSVIANLRMELFEALVSAAESWSASLLSLLSAIAAWSQASIIQITRWIIFAEHTMQSLWSRYACIYTVWYI